jgi:hypothetical protein
VAPEESPSSIPVKATMQKTVLNDLLVRASPSTAVVPNFLVCGATTVIYHPPELETSWFAQALAVGVAGTGGLEPFGRTTPTLVHLFTSEHDSEESQQSFAALFQHFVPSAAADACRSNLMISRLGDGGPLAAEASLDPLELATHVDPDSYVVIIDDVYPMLPAASRACETEAHVKALLQGANKLNAQGYAVLLMIARRSAAPLDLRANLARSIEVQLSPDSGGACESGYSILVTRRKTSLIDRAPTRFRYYCVQSEDGLNIGWDLPVQSEAAEERKHDRDRVIHDLKLRGISNADIARKLEVHPSTVGRALARNEDTGASDAKGR